MTAFQIVFAIIGAFLVGALFYYLFRVSGPWGSFWSFVLILILATIAVTAWITPFGPVYRDVAWLPILLVIILFALILAAATPPGGRAPARREVEAEPEADPSTGAVAAIGIFFFILVFFLAAAALVGILV